MRCFPIIRPTSRLPWLRGRVLSTVQRWIGDEAGVIRGSEAFPHVGDKPPTVPAQAEERQDSNESQKGPENGVSQRASARLPLSPLMDPKLIEARERYRTPKPAPSGELSTFSKKLLSNPYAQALATPVRQCRLTGLRLPNYFHLDFGLQNHPTTGKPWHLPKLALDAESKGSSQDAKEKEHSDKTEVPDGREMPNDPIPTATPQERLPCRTVTGTHFVAQRSALGFISRLSQDKRSKVFPYRWKMADSLNIKDVVWREDMDTYVLDLMRKSVLQELKYIGSRPAAYIVGCSSYQQVRKHSQVGAALWLGNGADETVLTSEEDVVEGDANADADTVEEMKSPPAYAMIDYRGRYIPVSNLQTLLGEEHLDQLKESNVVFRDKMAVVKRKRNTAQVQLALWKLMGYLAPDE